MRRLPLVLALILLSAPVLAETTYYTRQKEEARHGRKLPKGTDSVTCAQARNPQTSKASINGGIGCLSPGDTLVIGPGTYDELLVGQSSSSRECASGDATVQPGCKPIPNGIDMDHPTTLRASGSEVVVSPRGRRLPGGGKVVTILDYGRYIHLEGLRVVRSSVAGSVGGIYLGNSQSITLKANELERGEIKSGLTSRSLAILGNHIHHSGPPGCAPPGEKPKPVICDHGMYICGTDHVISDNLVEYGEYYGIQVSCEAGGIARIRLERNVAQYNWGAGIRCAGADCLVSANVLRGNGMGITLSGSGTAANNTIHGYHADPNNPDPTGIWVTYGNGSGFRIANNILTDMKSAYLAIGNQDKAPFDSAKVNHNMCESSGNPACTLIAQDDAIYRNTSAGDFTLKAGSPAIGAGISGTGVTSDVQGHPYPTPPDLGAYASSTTPELRRP